MRPVFTPASSPGAGSGPNFCLFEGNVAQLFSCFFLFTFSKLLGFCFLFIGNRLWHFKASLQRCWPLHMEVAESLLCVMFYKCFYSLKSVFSLKFKAKCHGGVIRLGEHVWQNDRRSLWCGWVSQSLSVPRPSLGSDTSLARVTPSEDASVVRNSGVHPRKLLFLHWPNLQDLVFHLGISYFCSWHDFTEENSCISARRHHHAHG